MTQVNFLAGGDQTPKGPRRLKRVIPDETVHHFPGVMYALGTVGVLSGIGSNLWQIFTTISAFWLMFYGIHRALVIDFSNVIFDICLLIAFSFQFALMMLVFRIDTAWKKHLVGSSSEKQHGRPGLNAVAVEIVQQVSLVLIWGALAFIVDTIGDYTFIGSKTADLDGVTQVFIIFMYAAALYALSTVAFVRSLEYLWAGFAVSDRIRIDREHRRTAGTLKP